MENKTSSIKENSRLTPICRRIHPRVEVFLPVQIEARTASNNLPLNLTGYTTDISEGGLGVILKERLKVSSNLKLFVDSTIHYPAFQTEAITLWKDTDILAKDGVIRYGLRFSETKDRDLVKDFLNKVNLHHVENFFGFALPDHLREACKDNYVFEKFDQKKIMEVIDFVPPFLKLKKMVVLSTDRQDILQAKSLGIGVITPKDTAGHYNETIYLAMCGWLMASAASVFLAILFPTTAPQVVEANGVKPLPLSGEMKGLWKPASSGTTFFVESTIIKKRFQLVIMKTVITFDNIHFGIIEELKLVLTPKNSIWSARPFPHPTILEI